MKRYDLVQVNSCYTTDHQMERADDGEWIRYEDVDQFIERCAELRNSSPNAFYAHVDAFCKSAVCDCAASRGNDAKPKQHGADPHAKDCRVYANR